MHKNPFPPSGGNPLSSPRLKPGASRGHSVIVLVTIAAFLVGVWALGQWRCSRVSIREVIDSPDAWFALIRQTLWITFA